MIRKLFTACASIALLSTSALALDVTGTYAGQGNGQNISVQLQENQGMVRGLVRVGGAEFPLAGQEQGGEVRGVWLAPNGQEIPFAVQVNGGKMEMATNGTTYSLRNDSITAPANVKQDDPRPATVDVQPQPVQNVQPQQLARPANVQMEQGQIFARPVPQGWQSQETSNEVYVWAPDNTLALGFTGMEGLTATTPAQFMQWMIVDIYHRGNFKIIQQHEVPSPDGGQTIEAVVSYTINGQPIKCWVRCTVLTLANSPTATCFWPVQRRKNSMAPSRCSSKWQIRFRSPM